MHADPPQASRRCCAYLRGCDGIGQAVDRSDGLSIRRHRMCDLLAEMHDRGKPLEIAQQAKLLLRYCPLNSMPIQNFLLRDFVFLREMRADAAYPRHLVERGADILVQLCETIEEENPSSLTQLYGITLRTMKLFHALYDDFLEEDCEIEAISQGIVGSDVLTIAEAYGFDAEYEELIAVRAFSLGPRA